MSACSVVESGEDIVAEERSVMSAYDAAAPAFERHRALPAGVPQAVRAAVLAALAVYIVSRRKLLRVFQVPGLILVPLVFLYPAVDNLELLKWGVFLAGLLTVAQFSFWGNYLPRVYPTYLRGTGESFAANIGGRMLGTSAALVTTNLTNIMPGGAPATKLAYAAATVAFLVYLGGFIASFWLPEPQKQDLPD